MNKERSIDSLDSLLSQSATIADNGFSQKIESEIRLLSQLRRRVFMGMACIWLVVALLLISPESLIAGFQGLVSAFTSLDFSADFASGLISEPSIGSILGMDAAMDNQEPGILQASFINIGLAAVAFVALASLVIRD